MQHSAGGAVMMANGASTLPPAGTQRLCQPGLNLGHLFKSPPASLAGKQKLQQECDRNTSHLSGVFYYIYTRTTLL